MPDATPWILATAAPHPMGFHCQRCGQSLNLALPVEVGDYVTTGRAFVAKHAACPAPPSPAGQTQEAGER